MAVRALCGILLMSLAPWCWAQTTPTSQTGPVSEEFGGPVRLRQPAAASATGLAPQAASSALPELRNAEPYLPGEFELFVQRVAGSITPIKRLGAELVTGDGDGRSADLSPIVPADYAVAPGDEVLVTLWGSVDGDLRLLVDRTGRIAIPRVGIVQVAGVRHGDLKAVIERRVAQVFRNFQLSVSLGQIRGVRVFVTGFVSRPGTYTVSSLSTVVSALMKAGGPSAAGSFRQIELRRGATLVSSFDLYDLLLRGDRSADQTVQAGDVIHVGPVGPQVGVIGSVNKPAVVELKPGQHVADALAMVGGPSSVADRTRLVLERLQDRATERAVELLIPRDANAPLSQGDVLRVFSSTDSLLSTQFQNKRIKVEGEVARPGEYVLHPASTLQDAIKAAGGLTPNAYLFGTDFSRESVRAVQQQNYDKALRDLETDFARTSASQRALTADEAGAQAQRAANTSRLIERLRTVRPTGRIVLQLEGDAKSLPSLAIEDGDRLLVPARPNTVGVFGSVYNSGNYLLTGDASIEDVLKLAGGPTRGADARSAFVLRANGSVVSAEQASNGWFGFGSTLAKVAAQPGDTVFVPEELNKTSFVQEAKEWTQILYQFGLGAAALKTLRN